MNLFSFVMWLRALLECRNEHREYCAYPHT